MDVDAIMNANVYIFDNKKDDSHTLPSCSGSSLNAPFSSPDKEDLGTKGNRRIMNVNAACATVNIRYP